MKKATRLFALCGAAVLFFAACGSTPEPTPATPAAPATESAPTQESAELTGTYTLNGSTSVERVISALIEAFEEEHTGLTLSFNPTGSGAGITSAQEGTADIGLSSRPLRDTEDGVDYIVFAIDGLAVIVHPDNPVADLSIAQINGIYTGQITNWSEVGGDDAPIAVIARDAGSGSRGAFDDIIGLGDDVQHDQELTSGGAVITAVATNPFAIGYASLSALNNSVVAITVEGVAITEETLIDQSFPVARPFIMLTQEGAEIPEAIAAFMAFIQSPMATEIITNAGVVQVR